MLILKDVTVCVNDFSVIQGLNLELKRGELHLLTGPNGSGKSSLVQLLLGNPLYQLQAGTLYYQDQDLMTLKPHERAQKGFFIVQQETVEIPGLKVLAFLKAAYDALECPKIEPVLFINKVKDVLLYVGLDESFMERSVHQGFSGGQKKRFELAQVLLFKPACVIFDEVDAGLDADGQQIFIKVLHELCTSLDVALFCISHNRQLFASFDNLVIHELAMHLPVGKAPLNESQASF